MITVQTKLTIKDNSGAKKGQCIQVYQGTHAGIGEIILVSIKQLRKKLKKKIKIKKGDLSKALIIQTKYKTKNTIGNYINFDQNNIILLNNQLQPISTRITSPVTNKLRKKKQLKIISLSSYIL